MLRKQARPPQVLKSGRLKRAKPAWDTVISMTTARRIKYLVDHGLASFSTCRLRIAAPFYVDFTGRRHKMPHGLVHGGV
jgi:hypothetical protein